MSRFIEIIKGQSPDFQFICKGVSDDQTRYFMNFVYCEDNKLISTDGRRLHILELEANPHEFKEKKFYRVLKATAKIVWFVEMDEDQGQFPNYKRVMPEGEHIKSIEYHSTNKIYATHSREIGKIMRLFDNGAALDIRYLEDLPNETIWQVQYFGNNRGMIFSCRNKTALLMPMQGD